MRKPDPVEAALNAISALRTNPPSPEGITRLQAAIRSKTSIVVSKAARLAGEWRVEEFIPDLVAAFDRLMKDPHKLDKGCNALIEVVGALYAMDYLGHEVYLRGIRHVQMEGAFGPPVDAAVPLRAVSALALVHSRYSDAMEEVVRLLADKEPGARLGAVRAIAAAGDAASPLLLRLKVLTGDPDADVLGECFAGLLTLTPSKALQFVGGFLEGDEAVAESAMLALGASRTAGAFEILKQASQRGVSPGLRKTLLLSIATLRNEEAIDFLLSLIANGPSQTSADAVAALELYRSDDKVRRNVEAAIASRSD